MGRARIYARRREEDIRKRAAKALLEKEYQESINKNPPFLGETICQNCGFKVRYKFIRCPECNEIQK